MSRQSILCLSDLDQISMYLSSVVHKIKSYLPDVMRTAYQVKLRTRI